MKHSLHQVFVEEPNGAVVPIGPRMNRDGCQQFVAAINRKIIEGTEKRWRNPHIANVI